MQVKYRILAFYRLLFSLVSSSYDFITLSLIIAESSIILAKYFPFLQLHEDGSKIQFFSHKLRFLYSHRHLLLFYH